MKLFTLPDLGEGLADAEIREWHVKVGDFVEQDQILVTVETAKAIVEIPSPYSGKIEKLYGEDGDVIETGKPLVAYEGEDSVEVAMNSQDTGTVVGEIQVGTHILNENPTGVQKKGMSKKGIKATPAIRNLAKKMGVALESIIPTGPNGTITAKDVKSVVRETGGEVISLQGMRRSMALAMAQAHADIVPICVFEDADIHHWSANEDLTLRVIDAVVSACKEVPLMNSHYNHESLTMKRFDQVNLAIAVDTEDGLYAPVLKNVQERSHDEIRQEIESFKTKGRKKAFKPEDLQGGTIGLSNYGSIAGRYATPIVIPPNVAIVGIGHARDEVVAFMGKPAIHRILPVTLTFDHRAATGGDATRFLKTLIQSLEHRG